MKYNKGFVGIGVIVAIIAALVVGGGVVYYATKTKAPSQENAGVNNYQPAEQNYTPPTTNNNPPQQQTPPPSPTPTAQQGFISPTQGSSYALGSNMSIKIKTSPQWFHCSNGFYLYNSSNQEIGTIGILTEPGKTSYSWPDTSKRYGTCGTGVGEIPISVSAGSYKICLKETNTETGVGQNFYCSGLFTLTSPVTQNQNSQNGCNPSDPKSITVISPNGGEIYSSGQQISVKWKSCNIPTNENMAIDLFNANDPSSGNCPLISPTPNDGNETVNLSVYSCRYLNFQSGNNFKLRVYQLNSPIGTTIQDFSNSNFTIN